MLHRALRFVPLTCRVRAASSMCAGDAPRRRRLLVRDEGARIPPALHPARLSRLAVAKAPTFVFVRFKPVVLLQCPPLSGAGGNKGGRDGWLCDGSACDHHHIHPGAGRCVGLTTG